MFGSRLSRISANEADRFEAPTAGHAEPPAPAGGEQPRPMDIRGTLALIESDIVSTLHDVVDHAASLNGQISRKIELAESVGRQTASLTGMTETAGAHCQSLNSAIGAMSSANQEIRRRVDETSNMSNRATAVAREASASVAELKQSSSEIGEVVEQIAAIARQTNLLALNATIEAARAGDAGRGFAVVAGEVKSLSVETQNATKDIADRIADLQRTAEASIAAVSRIADIIAEFAPVLGAVSTAVESQVTTSEGLNRAAGDTSVFVTQVASHVEDIDKSTVEVVELGQSAQHQCARLGTFIESLDLGVTMLLRQSETADAGVLERLPIELDVDIAESEGRRRTTTIDLSDIAATLAPVDDWSPKPGDEYTLEIASVGTIGAKLVGASRFGLKFALHAHGSPAEARLRQIVGEVRDAHSIYIDRAIATAASIAEAIENAIVSGSLSETDVFDVDYRAIPGTDPQQYSTRYLEVFDRVLPDIQEPALALDTQMVFCASVDRNGYLPVHNRVFAKPQRPGDPAWNAANCRNRRIFTDRAGLSAARNTRPYLVQSYARDMGNGQVVMMKEIDAPVAVRGRHWGGVRMGYRF